MAVETKLRNLRTSRNLTMKQVADAVGISLPGYQQIEVGDKSVSAEKAKLIAGHFGVDVTSLFVPKYFTASIAEAM